MQLRQLCAAVALALTLFSAGCCCWRDCSCRCPMRSLMCRRFCRPCCESPCRPSCCETPCCAPSCCAPPCEGGFAGPPFPPHY